MDKDAVSPALGKVSSGIYIATSILDGSPVGMLASFVEQAGFDPPFITIALQPDRLLEKALAAGAPLGLNVVGENDNALMKPFAQSGNDDPFEGLDVEMHDGRVPRLTKALAFLAAEPKGSLDTGDHRVYACEVIGGALQNQDDKPMVRIRKNGFGY